MLGQANYKIIFHATLIFVFKVGVFPKFKIKILTRIQSSY